MGPWLLRSNYLVIVAAVNESYLLDMITQAHQLSLPRTAVREPDLPNEPVTAVAFAPGVKARRLCANLPLALKTREHEAAMT